MERKRNQIQVRAVDGSAEVGGRLEMTFLILITQVNNFFAIAQFNQAADCKKIYKRSTP